MDNFFPSGSFFQILEFLFTSELKVYITLESFTRKKWTTAHIRGVISNQNISETYFKKQQMSLLSSLLRTAAL